MSETSGAQVEALLFDLFGVLITFDDNIVYRRLADHCAEPEFAFKSLSGLLSGLNVITGRQSLAQTHSILQETLGLNLDFHAFVKAWNEPYSASMPGMPKLLESLHGRYRLLMLSNVDTDYWQSIRPMHPEFELFDDLLISGELGMAKPSPVIFKHAVSVAGIAPERCLFIDDTLRNVDAARGVGLQGHWFRGLPGLQEDLRQRGVVSS